MALRGAAMLGARLAPKVLKILRKTVGSAIAGTAVDRVAKKIFGGGRARRRLRLTLQQRRRRTRGRSSSSSLSSSTTTEAPPKKASCKRKRTIYVVIRMICNTMDGWKTSSEKTPS